MNKYSINESWDDDDWDSGDIDSGANRAWDSEPGDPDYLSDDDDDG